MENPLSSTLLHIRHKISQKSTRDMHKVHFMQIRFCQAFELGETLGKTQNNMNNEHFRNVV